MGLLGTHKSRVSHMGYMSYLGFLLILSSKLKCHGSRHGVSRQMSRVKSQKSLGKSEIVTVSRVKTPERVSVKVAPAVLRLCLESPRSAFLSSLQYSTTPPFLSPIVATSTQNVATNVATLTSKITRFYRHCCDVATCRGVNPGHPPAIALAKEGHLLALPLLLLLFTNASKFSLLNVFHEVESRQIKVDQAFRNFRLWE
jgi:hypothetical protein